MRSWEQASHAGLPSAYAPSTAESPEHVRIADALLASGLMWVDWIDLRHGDDMLFAGGANQPDVASPVP